MKPCRLFLQPLALLGAAVLLFGLLGGCNSTDSNPASDPTSESAAGDITRVPTPTPLVQIAEQDPFDVELTADDDGSTVEMGVGHTMRIRLKGKNFGWAWKVRDVDDQVLDQIGNIDVLRSGSYIAIRFEAVGIGETPINIEYHPIGSPDRNHFSVNVIVK